MLLAFIVVLSSFTQPGKKHNTPPPAAPPVTVTDDGTTYTLSNGYLTIKVNKRTGDLTSVKTPKTTTPNIELMGYVSGHHAGYWEQSPAQAAREVTGITIDPSTNNGERAEVSVKGYSDGTSILGRNPTAAGQGGGLIADLEIRYTLERGPTAYILMPSIHIKIPIRLVQLANRASVLNCPELCSTGFLLMISATLSCLPVRIGMQVRI